MNTLANGQPDVPVPARESSLGAAEVGQLLGRLEGNIASVVLGKPDVIRLAVVALLAEGHLLLEDFPGVGKTLLAKALAKSLGCAFHRIQCTPDLLPSDLIGTSVFNQVEQRFVFQAGPLFAQIILVDEINRATPRTQSALLEAMSERQVTVDGVTHPLGRPFMVLATQNPFEFEGTFPLPENQLDRFLMRGGVGYPDRAAERDILIQHRAGEPVDNLGPVLCAADVVALQSCVRNVRIEPSLVEYMLDIVTATRRHDRILLGASPRAGLALYRAAQAQALVAGRDFVVPDDIKSLAPAVLGHRLIVRGSPGSPGAVSSGFLTEILERTAVPA